MKTDITVQDLHQQIETGGPITIIDVRQPDEFAGGHVPGAINIPLDQIVDDIPGRPSDERLHVICRGGVRSVTACEKLDAKHTNLVNILGGTQAWIDAGYEVEN